MKIKKKIILQFFYNVFLVILLGVAVLLVLSKYPVTGNIKFLIVRSGSMEPAIFTGSIVVVRPRVNYKVGDVVTYRQINEPVPVTHRIVEQKQENGQTVYFTKGDANDAADMAAVHTGQIEGKVMFHIPYIGYVIAAAQQPLGFLIIIVVPALIIIYDESVNVYKEVKKLKKDKAKKKSDA